MANNDFAFQGALGGLVAGQEFAQQRDKNDESLLNQMLMNKQQESQNYLAQQTMGDKVGISNALGREAASKTPEWFASQRGGEMADSSMRVRKDSNEKALNAGMLKVEQRKQLDAISDADAKQMSKLVEFAGQMGPMLENTPAPARISAFQDILTKAGYDMNNPMVQQLMKAGPDGLPQAIGAMAEGMAMTLALRGEIKKQGQKSASDYVQATDVADINAEASGRNASIMANARTGSEKEFDRILEMMASPDPKVRERAKDYMKNKYGAANNNPVDNRANAQAKAEGEGAGKIATMGAFEQQSKAMAEWGSYDPGKYEYGINPATGKFARRLKGE